MPEAHANVIILDACRNNPFAGTIAAHRGIGVSRGLTPMDHKELRSVIVFSTKPNSVAADGRRPQLAVHGRAAQAHERKRPRNPSDDLARPQGRSRRDMATSRSPGTIPRSSTTSTWPEATSTVPSAPPTPCPSDPGLRLRRRVGTPARPLPSTIWRADPQPVHGTVAARPGALRGPMGGGRNLP